LTWKKKETSENRIELTKDYSDAQQNGENLKSDEGKSYTEKTQGISIDKESMAAKDVQA
jgi:hypothetical protein